MHIYLTIDEYKAIYDLVQMHGDLTDSRDKQLLRQLAHKLGKLAPNYGIKIEADPSFQGGK
jgi:hypothetical protein